MNDTGFQTIADRPPRRFTVNGNGTAIDLVDVVSQSVDQGLLRYGRNPRVIALALTVSAVGTISFVSGEDVLFEWTFPTGELTLILPRNADGWFEGGPDYKLILKNDGGLTVVGGGVYVLT